MKAEHLPKKMVEITEGDEEEEEEAEENQEEQFKRI